MDRKMAIRGGCAAAVFVLLAWLAVKSREKHGYSDDRASVARADMLHLNDRNGETGEPGKMRTRERPAMQKQATEEEAARFRRFFLPPVKFQDVTLGEAVALLVQTYRQTGKDTQGNPVALKVDLSRARDDRRITWESPHSTAGAVLRHLGALTGNQTEGALPDFHMTALDQSRDRKHTGNAPPELESLLAKQAGGSSGQSLKELLMKAGVGDEGMTARLEGGKLTLENVSAADLEVLASMVNVENNGGMGQVQTKLNISVLSSAETLLPEGWMLTGQEEMNQLMRRAAQTVGTDLMTMPSIITRPGERAMIEIIRDVPGAGGAAPDWAGVRAVATTSPLGLGHEVDLEFEIREEGRQPVVLRQKTKLPEGGTAADGSTGTDGKKLLILPTPVLIDARGHPIADGEP